MTHPPQQENIQELGAGFFPPDEQNQKSLKPATPGGPSPSSTSDIPNSNSALQKAAPPKVTPAAAAPPPSSIEKEPLQESSTQRRKSSYVPPAPIFPPPANSNTNNNTSNATSSAAVPYVPPQSPNEASSSSLGAHELGPSGSSASGPPGQTSIDFGAFQKTFGGSAPLSPGSSVGSASHPSHTHSKNSNTVSSSVAYQAAGQPRRSSKIVGEALPHQPPPLHTIVTEDGSHKTGGGRSSLPSDNSSGVRSNNSRSVPPIPGIILEQETTEDDRKHSSNSANKKKKQQKSSTSSPTSEAAQKQQQQSPPPEKESPTKLNSSGEKIRMPHHQQRPHEFYDYPKDSPEPSSNSGMRFDELYKLKGVVRFEKQSQHYVDTNLPD